MKTIDTHTHVLADDTIKILQKEMPSLGLKLSAFDADNSMIEVAGVPYRPFPRRPRHRAAARRYGRGRG